MRKPTNVEVKRRMIKLPKPKKADIKKTIIFDMDETLIHCVDDIESENPDVVLNIKFPSGDVVEAGINIRPYALHCLKEANKYF